MNSPRKSEPSIVLHEVGIPGGSVDVSTPGRVEVGSARRVGEGRAWQIGTRGDEDLRTTTLLLSVRESDPIRVTHMETATRMPSPLSAKNHPGSSHAVRFARQASAENTHLAYSRAAPLLRTVRLRLISTRDHTVSARTRSICRSEGGLTRVGHAI
jgi:hypothetical protein